MYNYQYNGYLPLQMKRNNKLSNLSLINNLKLTGDISCFFIRTSRHGSVHTTFTSDKYRRNKTEISPPLKQNKNQNGCSIENWPSY